MQVNEFLLFRKILISILSIHISPYHQNVTMNEIQPSELLSIKCHMLNANLNSLNVKLDVSFFINVVERLN